MKRIEKDELYQHLSEFLKTKGIELTAGSYSQGIHKTCSMLADVINLSQQGLERAKTGVDKKIDRVRQVIHEKTAPKASSPTPTAAASESPAGEPSPSSNSAPKAAPKAPRRAAAKKKASRGDAKKETRPTKSA